MSSTTRENKSLKRALYANRKKSSSEFPAELMENANIDLLFQTARKNILEGDWKDANKG